MRAIRRATAHIGGVRSRDIPSTTYLISTPPPKDVLDSLKNEILAPSGIHITRKFSWHYIMLLGPARGTATTAAPHASQCVDISAAIGFPFCFPPALPSTLYHACLPLLARD